MLKSKLENELILGMDHELFKKANNHDYDQLHNAVDYINSAIDILESSGFESQADKLLNLIYKIATFEKEKVLTNIPSLQYFKETDALGFSYKFPSGSKSIWDILVAIDRYSGNEKNKLKAILNNIVRSEGSKIRIANILNKSENELTEDDFRKILEQNYLSEEEAAKNLALSPKLRSNLKFDLQQYLKDRKEKSPRLFSDEELDTFVSENLPQEVALAYAKYKMNKNAKPRKPKNPLKISDKHTKNLDSKKMVKNLLDHGTVFNMDANLADDFLDEDVDFEDEE